MLPIKRITFLPLHVKKSKPMTVSPILAMAVRSGQASMGISSWLRSFVDPAVDNNWCLLFLIDIEADRGGASSIPTHNRAIHFAAWSSFGRHWTEHDHAPSLHTTNQALPLHPRSAMVSPQASRCSQTSPAYWIFTIPCPDQSNLGITYYPTLLIGLRIFWSDLEGFGVGLILGSCVWCLV